MIIDGWVSASHSGLSWIVCSTHCAAGQRRWQQNFRLRLGASWLKGERTDHEDRLAAEWLQKQGILVSVEVAGQAAQTAARDRPFNPMKSYLQGLRWDGVERLDRWLSTYLGTEDSGYSRAVGSRWLISAVARIFRPGAKAIVALSLKARKRSANQLPSGRLPANPSRMNSPILGSKDAAMQTRGVGIIELSELDSLSRAEVARTKASMSRTTDRFRPPYGMRLVELLIGGFYAQRPVGL
jgi:predicted P-loop ATPase